MYEWYSKDNTHKKLTFYFGSYNTSLLHFTDNKNHNDHAFAQKKTILWLDCRLHAVSRIFGRNAKVYILFFYDAEKAKCW